MFNIFKNSFFIAFLALTLTSCGSGSSDNTNMPNNNSPSNNIPSNSSSDIDTPTVKLIYPVNEATDVSENTTIKLQFNESVINVNTDTIQLRKGTESGEIVLTTAITAESDNIYSFKSIHYLEPGIKYFIMVSNSILSLQNNTPLKSTSFYFTISDNINPNVTMKSPINRSNDVTQIPVIQIQFVESVSNVNPKTISLHRDSESGKFVPLEEFIQGENHTYTFSPKKFLNPLTKYYLVIDNGITSVETGKSIESASFNFTTGFGPRPTVLPLSPANRSTNNPTSINIQLKFSSSVQNVNSDTITLHAYSESGPLVMISPIFDGPYNTFTFSPLVNLERSTKYYIVLSDKIVSAYNSTTLNATNFNFTTDSTISAPNVTMINPINNTFIKTSNPSIQLKFSEDFLTTKGVTSIYLRQDSPLGTIIPSSLIYGAGNIATIQPKANLSNGTYYVTVESGIYSVNTDLPVKPTNFHFTVESMNLISPL